MAAPAPGSTISTGVRSAPVVLDVESPAVVSVVSAVSLSSALKMAMAPATTTMPPRRNPRLLQLALPR